MTKTRKDNVEYHKGQIDKRAGLALWENPYPYNADPDSRFERWRAGWKGE